MNWHLIFKLSLLSIVMGTASVLGLTRSYEWLMWLLVGVLSAWQFAKKTREERFLHGLCLGIFIGTFNASIQAVFLPTYLLNNPGMVEALNALPQNLHPAAVVLIMGPIIGAFSGVVFGLLAAIAGKLLHSQVSDSPSS
jgi:hypothetical protein